MSELSIESRLEEMGLRLPPAPPPGGVYKPVVVVDRYIYVSGTIPVKDDGTFIYGRLGDDMDIEAGYAAAKQVALTILSVLKTHFGPLHKIKRLVKSLGMVNCTPDFHAHPKVINGYSELMREVLGLDHGVGARSAVGMMLPLGVAVEIEAIFEIKNAADYGY